MKIFFLNCYIILMVLLLSGESLGHTLEEMGEELESDVDWLKLFEGNKRRVPKLYRPAYLVEMRNPNSVHLEDEIREHPHTHEAWKAADKFTTSMHSRDEITMEHTDDDSATEEIDAEIRKELLNLAHAVNKPDMKKELNVSAEDIKELEDAAAGRKTIDSVKRIGEHIWEKVDKLGEELYMDHLRRLFYADTKERLYEVIRTMGRIQLQTMIDTLQAQTVENDRAFINNAHKIHRN